ncbi:hypothetical protein [Pararhodospirillum photometricum]|uniref:Uncharacterized protein n=1 Tax=Pararhodospirillum photometricum DSM 122 TaxID=1150469 RepID=H6SS45_PARPM|nr:hypothetical protein [Pararhodospirillum photometricum]CCG07724.1 Putative uncharacterized protein [Pararhodospirillum photometricum DSM 122]
MDAGQDIGLGGAALTQQAYAGSFRQEPIPIPTEQESALPSASGVGATAESTGDTYNLDTKIILDPNFYVSVTQFTYGEDFNFQVPSREQIEAYLRGKEAHDVGLTEQQQRALEDFLAQRQIVEVDGGNVKDVQAVGVVAAAALSQAFPSVVASLPVRDTAASPDPTTSAPARSAGPLGRAVEVEA